MVVPYERKTEVSVLIILVEYSNFSFLRNLRLYEKITLASYVSFLILCYCE